MRLSCVFALGLAVIGTGSAPVALLRSTCSTPCITRRPQASTLAVRHTHAFPSSLHLRTGAISSGAFHRGIECLIASRRTYQPPSPLLWRALYRQFLCQGRHLCGRYHSWRRSGGSPGCDRRARRHERHSSGDRSFQRPHPGDGQSEARTFAWRRALLHHQAFGGPRCSERRVWLRATRQFSWRVSA